MDTEVRNLLRQRLRESLKGPLRCVIGTDRRERSDATQARHLDDVSPTLRTHDWQRRLGDPQRPEKVRFELGAHILFREFLDHAEMAIASIIDNNIEPAEVVGSSLHRLEG